MSNNVSSTPDALPVGTRLMDYDIEGLLGVGGFGLVYRAREAALQRVVAIKEFLPSSLAARGSDGSVVLRAPQHGEAFALGLRSFVNEARLLARFDHPALVRVIRFWEDRGTAYMVMPCYEGQTLYEARRDLSGPPDEAWLRALMEPLLGALDCLHREQVYHRDVAPDNILILKDPDAPCGIRPVLLDFGAARRVLGDHTQALTAILKPSFAPIEQYAETSQLRQGPWTDLYGLAAVLHYCVTGRTPVPATARAVHDDLPSLRQMATGLAQDFGQTYSPALLATIDRALSVKPDERPASVAAWREALIEQPRTVDLSRPSEGVSATQPTVDASRDVWTERTVMVARPAEGQAGKVEGGRVPEAMPMSDLFHHPRAAAWPRAAWWGGGALLLAAVVALSAWSFKRDRAAPVGSATQAVVLAQASDGPADLASAAGIPGPEVPPARPTEPAVKASVVRPAKNTAASRETRSGGAKASSRKEGSSDTTRDASAPLNPRLACGERVFIALAVCMKRHCSRPAYAKHAECTRMRQQEDAQRQRMGGF
ncbi:MAG TPA: serine/threonine-protein kinase [Aquabacterium sp.]|uniref:serine/threonine protein kinase n=1 Tax=Aquabacterium sp. TaxID=1872578 RepID=UPI002E366133|nr:serine/threonine-protein kinase [Aquabacterium sp.]HEX5372024.1 serine/threonine-protein kinase [Aquabacterium sp.]